MKNSSIFILCLALIIASVYISTQTSTIVKMRDINANKEHRVDSLQKVLDTLPPFDSLSICISEKPINKKIDYVVVDNRTKVIKFKGYLKMTDDINFVPNHYVLGNSGLYIMAYGRMVGLYTAGPKGEMWGFPASVYNPALPNSVYPNNSYPNGEIARKNFAIKN